MYKIVFDVRNDPDYREEEFNNIGFLFQDDEEFETEEYNIAQEKRNLMAKDFPLAKYYVVEI